MITPLAQPHTGRPAALLVDGQPLAYVYGDDRPQGASSHVLTVDEARRIALGITRLPELINRPAGAAAVPSSI